jgi:vitamin B12 transporter
MPEIQRKETQRRAALFGLCCIALVHRARAETAPAPLEVSVRGRPAPLAHARRAPSVASTVLGGERLSGAGVTSADVLARVPGVQVTRTGAQSDVATASIRGAEADQVPIYLAGVRLNDEVSGTADLSSVPLWLIERVEVFRGNAPDDADRLGIGGAIFFWPRVPRKSGGGAGVEVGSFGERAGWAFGEVGSRRAASLVALRRSGADNDYTYVDDQGQRFDRIDRTVQRQNADYTQTDAWAIGRYELGRDARLNSVLSVVDREQGATSLSSTPVLRARARTRRWLFGNSVVLPCGSGDACRLELDASAIAASSSISDPARELPALQARIVDQGGERVSQRARLELAFGPELSLAAGVHVALENLRVRRDVGAPRGGNRRTLMPSLAAEWRLGSRLSLHLLGALECHFTRGSSVRFGVVLENDGESCGARPVGRLGLAYALAPGLELLSNLARYVRTPTLSELYGTSSLVDGNPNLRVESGVSLDLGLRWTGRFHAGRDALSFDAFAFARQADDLVRYRRSSLEAMTPFNVAQARLLGAELAVAADLFAHLRLEGAGTLLDARETTPDPVLDPTTNDVLPNTPRLTLSTLVALYFAPALEAVRMNRASVGVRYSHKSSRYADPAGQIVLPEQHFVDLEAAAHFLDDRLIARAALDNLFDSQTSDLLGLPVPGRSYHGSLALSF